jgi:hypothetical protein
MRIETVPPLLPSRPTCGRVMRHTGHSPTCDGAIYDFLCSNDGDPLSGGGPLYAARFFWSKTWR